MTTSKNTNGNSKVLLVVIAGLFALVIAMGAGFFYMLTQQNNQPQQVEQQLSASDIAKIVRQTMDDSEQEQREQALAAMLEPWKAAHDGKNRIYGNLDARFSIVTFSDLECPFCKKFNNTPKEVVDASGGAVNFEFRHMPLDFHNPAALDGALMVECVAKEKGNQYALAFIDQYFQRTQTNGSGVSDLNALMKSFGLTQEQINACKSDEAIAKRVQDDIAFGASAGVSGTPSSFVVDTKMGQSIQIGGAQGAQVFMNAIRSLLEKEKEAEGEAESGEENAESAEEEAEG